MNFPHLSPRDPQPRPEREEDLFNWLRLLRSRRVGHTTFWRLMEEYKSVENALAALPDVAAKAGVSKYEICPSGVIEAELKAGAKIGAQLVTRTDTNYPPELTTIDAPPPLLWTIGQVDMMSRPKIALVGARNASSLGTRMARKLAADLGDAGFVIVSGLARGVDSAAHSATLDTGTIAVMAGGVDVIYPTENTELAKKISRSGLRVSDQPIGTQPLARHFPARNRIISGMSSSVIVVEAAGKSGSLITARNALDQGRDVMAVPGHPFDGRAAGCNMLIRDGAILVRSAEDVIEHIGQTRESNKVSAEPTPDPQPSNPSISDLHVAILQRLGPSPVAEDQLIRDLQAPSAEVAPALVALELDGQIVRQAGGLLARAS